MNFFRYKLIRLVAFVLLWLRLGYVISIFNQPAFTSPNDFFYICANQMYDGRILPTYLLKDYEQNPSGYQLCRTPFVKETKFAEIRLVFTQNADGSYLLKTWQDSPADPIEYHYRITGDAVEPIAWRRGSFAAQLMAYFWGLVLTLVGRWLVGRVCQKQANAD